MFDKLYNAITYVVFFLTAALLLICVCVQKYKKSEVFWTWEDEKTRVLYWFLFGSCLVWDLIWTVYKLQ